MTTPWTPEQREAAEKVIEDFTKSGKPVPSDVKNYLSGESSRQDSPDEIKAVSSGRGGMKYSYRPTKRGVKDSRKA